MGEEHGMYAWPRLVRERDLIQWAGDIVNRLNSPAVSAPQTLYLCSPNGTRWAITVSDAGALTVTMV